MKNLIVRFAISLLLLLCFSMTITAQKQGGEEQTAQQEIQNGKPDAVNRKTTNGKSQGEKPLNAGQKAVNDSAVDNNLADSMLESTITSTPDTDIEPIESAGFHQALKTKFIEGNAGFMSLVALALVIGLAFCIERIIYLSLSEINAKQFMRDLEAKINTGDIEAAKAALARDPKNRAENTLIVDLLRNDLSKIARPHGVSVSDAFHVARHGEVLQMTSRVNARLRPGITHAAILRAAYPCGSITGAPKRITMQTIAALEGSPRDLYTGALGYIEPEEMRLNVAIRTLQITGGHARFGVGSGITIDSDADDEYRECQLKTAFLRHPPDIGLIETLRVADGAPQQLDAHLARLAASADALGLPCDAAALRAQCAREITANMPPPLRSGGGLGWGCEKPRSDKTQSALLTRLTRAIPQIHRLKITLQRDGHTHIELAPLAAIARDVFVCEHGEALPDRDPLRRHKSTHRAHLDRIWQAAVAAGAFDALLYNESGYLLEGARSSVFLQIDGVWHTPPLTLDILPGIARARILAEPALIGATHITESRLTRADVARADTLILTNSLRGVLTARLIA